MQCACAILSSVACPALQYFFTLQTARFPKKKSYWTQNVCFDFVHNFCLTHFSFFEELSEIWLKKMFIDLVVKYLLFWSDCNETWILSTVFSKKKLSNIKFCENPSIGSRAVPFRHKDMKLIVSSRDFANAPNNGLQLMVKDAVVTHCRYHRSSNANGL